MNLISILKNKVVFYLVSRYITYGVQFITSLVIATKLGPYYMGIWGLILLLLQYFQQFHLGIANSFNVLYVHHMDNVKECNNYIANSLMLVSYLSILVVCFYAYYQLFAIGSFGKYHADKYIIWISLIAILQYFVQFFVSLFRVRNMLNRVTFCQSIIVLLNFACVFFFRGDELIKWLVAGYVVGNAICVILALTSGTVPFNKKVKINVKYQLEILKKGLYLFFYNSCFYFIIISVRTIISGYYKVEDFGVFTFSFSLAHAILLILEAMSFIIFPKVLSKLSSNIVEEVKSTLTKLRVSYITCAHFLVYLVLPFFPLFLYLMPKYANAVTSMNLIVLTILMQSNSYGYLELLISHNKEKLLALMSSIALVLNIVLALALVKLFNVEFSYVIIATMITYYVFTFFAVMIGARCLSKVNVLLLIKEQFPLRLLIPYLTALTISLLEYENLMFVPIFVFVLLNVNSGKQIIETGKSILTNSEKVNL